MKLNEELLNQIYDAALSKDYLVVIYDTSNEKMLRQIIKNLENKLDLISGLLKVLAGD